MKTKLSKRGETPFNLLTASTFYVVDCEYTATNDAARTNSIISIAIVPVVQGVRARADQELYCEMNPGVPISADSTRANGFTDKKVKKLKRFNDHAVEILEALSDENAVFVAHTSADIHALRAELIRLDERKAVGEIVAAGLEDLPSLPIIDTSTLGRTLRYPGIGSASFIKLSELCKLTDVKNANPHNAKSDARATADVLIELLAYAAQVSARSDLGEILREHRGGSTHDPRKAIVFRDEEPEPELPQAHIDKHLKPLNKPATSDEITQWVELASECSLLRCQWLVQDAVLAGEFNAPALLEQLVGLLSTLTEPGQANTLIGVLCELLEPRARAGGLGVLEKKATYWWRDVKPIVTNSAPCGDNNLERCPACRQGEPCPRDILYQFVAQTSMYNQGNLLSKKQVRNFFKEDSGTKFYRWRMRLPELAAYAAWLVISGEVRYTSSSSALGNLSKVYEMGLHIFEPRLALLTAEMLKVEEKSEEALALCKLVLSNRTSDRAFVDLEQWMQLTQVEVEEQARIAAKQAPIHPRLSRPAGRVNRNPYSVL